MLKVFFSSGFSPHFTLGLWVHVVPGLAVKGLGKILRVGHRAENPIEKQAVGQIFKSVQLKVSSFTYLNFSVA